MKKCIVCGVEFEPKNKKGVMCSVKCRVRNCRKRAEERAVIVNTPDPIITMIEQQKKKQAEKPEHVIFDRRKSKLGF